MTLLHNILDPPLRGDEELPSQLEGGEVSSAAGGLGINGEETYDLEVVKVAGGEDGKVAGGEVVWGVTGWVGSRGERMGESGWV